MHTAIFNAIRARDYFLNDGFVHLSASFIAMRFEKILPGPALRPYVRYYVLSEQTAAQQYTVLPLAGMVMGLQYRGQLETVSGTASERLASIGITGMTDRYKVFRSAPGIGSVLIYFTETGLAHFSRCPAHELFNLSVAGTDLFDRQAIADTEERLAAAADDPARIGVVEHFLRSQYRERDPDRLVTTAVQRIQEQKGMLRMKELSRELLISQSPLEKRFRAIVGTSPRKFASIVRFNAVIQALDAGAPLMDVCHNSGYFDQAHFIRDFKQFTGRAPGLFRRQL